MNTNLSKLAGNRFVPILAGCYALLWVLLAIHPVDRGDWLLENLLVFAAMAVLVFTYSRFQFSSLTYALLTLFFALHAAGAHYTYAKVPAVFGCKIGCTSIVTISIEQFISVSESCSFIPCKNS